MMYKAVSTFDPSNLISNRYSLLFNELGKQGLIVKVLDSPSGKNLDELILLYKQELAGADLIFHLPPYIDNELYRAYQRDLFNWIKNKESWSSGEFDLINKSRLEKESFFKQRLNDYIRGLSTVDKIIDSEVFVRDVHEFYDILKINSMPSVEHLTFDDWSNNKFFPAVFKINNSSQGSGIYVVDDELQLKKMLNPASFGVVNICAFDINNYRVSRFIECPSNHYTHYRVFTVGSGKILGAVLSYSDFTKSDDIRIESDWCMDAFDYPDSPLFLNRRDIMSNKSRGGSQIPLNPNKNSRLITDYEELILLEHGITNQELPKKINDYAITAARLFGKKGLYVLGQDWIQDLSGNFFCLEVNCQPGLELFGTVYNSGNNNGCECIASKLIANEIINQLIKIK